MRHCPSCQRPLDPLALRCVCGFELPEGRDVRSHPDRPVCGVCGREMELMELQCPGCGASGYPALRPRRGKKSAGSDTTI